MTDIVTASSNKLDNWSDSGPWYEGTHGERIAVRVSSLDTNGAYAVVESIAAPGCATNAPSSQRGRAFCDHRG